MRRVHACDVAEQLRALPITPRLGKTDEAHGTAGDLGRPWAAIHDNARIPADFRLYLTATPAHPRRSPAAEGLRRQEVEIATMADDPNGTYGAWIAELGLS
ncbi:putative helicase [Streptomyces sp. DSM 42143]|nr:putative helicase [Streptomyces sp. DSM 42143]